MRTGTLAYIHSGPHRDAYGVVAAASMSEVIVRSAGGDLSVRPACCIQLPRRLPAGPAQMYSIGAPEQTSIPILDENRLVAARVLIEGTINQDLAHQMAAAPFLLALLSDLAEEAPDDAPTKRLAECVVDYLTRPRIACPTCLGAGAPRGDAVGPCETCDGTGTIAGPRTAPLAAQPAATPAPAPAPRAVERRVRLPPLKRFEQIGLRRLLVEGQKRARVLRDVELSALVGLSIRGTLVTHSDVQSSDGFLFALTPAGERVARELVNRGERLSVSHVRVLKRLSSAGEAGMVLPGTHGGSARVLREEAVPRLVEYVPSESGGAGPDGGGDAERASTVPAPRQRLTAAGRAWLAAQGASS